MFKPTSAKDRINYGEALLPPIGYHLEKAIGTTYSLDLETLTAVSIALGLIEDTDSELISNPISMLNALQKVSDKIVVFCEAGQIKLPSKANALCLILEKMVVPVKLDFNKVIDKYPSFHPKTWILEYANTQGEKQYRFVVLSRNMTFDHSWDIACAMDGSIKGYDCPNTNPIINFLQFLKKQLNKEYINYKQQYSVLEHLIKVLHNVEFDVDQRFDDYQIMPLGIGKTGYDMKQDSLLNAAFDEIVVISPFITGSIIEDFNSNKKSPDNDSRTLITRRSELPKISKNQASRFDVYVMKDDIVDGEEAISEDVNTEDIVDYPKQDIHAKMYLRRRNNSVDLYLGSMNASYAAINANVEMLLRLHTKSSILNSNILLTDIIGNDPDKSPFQLVKNIEIDNTDTASAKDQAEIIIKKICRLKMNAFVSQSNDRYNVVINVETPPDNPNIKIRPLSSNKECVFSSRMEFPSLGILQISEFYVLSVSVDECTMERVIMIPTVGLPENRDTEIIKSVVKDKKSFIEYVAFVLGDDYVQSFIENHTIEGNGEKWGLDTAMPAVYEKMLKTSLSDPDRIKEIQYITKLVDDETIIPKEFKDMYQVFCETLGIK